MHKRRRVSIAFRLIAVIMIAVAMAVTFLSITTTDDVDEPIMPVFSDVSEEMRPYIETVYLDGLMSPSGGGKFGTYDKISFNEMAYIANAFYEKLNGIKPSQGEYSPDGIGYIEKAAKYGIWQETGRAASEYLTRSDAGAILGAFVNDSFPIYGDAHTFRDMPQSINSQNVLKLYNCGITLDKNINNAYTDSLHITRGEVTELICMILNPSLRITALTADYTALEQELRLQMSGYQGDWSLYFKDVDNQREISINSHQVYSASLIKLYVAQAVCTKMYEGSIADNAANNEHLSRMLTWSDNKSWQALARIMGGGSYSRGMEYTTLIAQATGFLDTGTFYKGDKRNFNFTSVNDCGKYLNMLLDGTIVNPVYSERILGLLKQQQVRYKIPAGVPQDIIVANKTGELEYVQGDAAIVYSPACTYILTVIADNLTDTDTACMQIKKLSETVYSFLN